jgi:dGTPase
LGRTGEVASTLEGRIVSVCDAIAYINHDIDDAVRARVISLDQLPQDALNTLGGSPSERINSMVIGLIEASKEGEVGIVEEVREAINALRDFLYTELYPSESINVKIRKATKLLRELYGYLMEQPDDLVPEIVPGDPLDRRVVDFLAGMTDHYALRLYEDLFFPESWPV